MNRREKEANSFTKENFTTHAMSQPLTCGFLPSLRDLLSNTNNEVHIDSRRKITLLLIDLDISIFDNLEHQNSISIENILHASNLIEAKALLNTKEIDVCIMRPDSKEESAKGVLKHIAKYDMACGSVVLHKCTDPIIENSYLEMGATDIFPIEEFDSVIAPRIIQLCYIHATMNYKHNLKFKKFENAIIKITGELENSAFAIEGCSKLLRHLNVNASLLERRVFAQLVDNMEYLKNILGAIDSKEKQ